MREPPHQTVDRDYAANGATPAPARPAALSYCLSSSRFSGATSRATAPARAPVAISARRCGAITSDRISDANPTASSGDTRRPRSEEHTSELQSLTNLVCRLLHEKKKNT